MNETQYTNKFMKAWKAAEPTLWWHKVADPTTGGWMSRTRAVDVIACLDGRLIGMEWKLRKNDGRFSISAVRHIQVLTLLSIQNAGGYALVAIGRYKKHNDRLVYLIPVREWVKRCGILKEPNDTTSPPKSVNLHDTFGEFEFRPWDFKWFGYNIRKYLPTIYAAPTPERMKELHGDTEEK